VQAAWKVVVRPIPRFFGLALAGVVLTLTSGAIAQPSPPNTEPGAAVTPPRLLKFVPALGPEDAAPPQEVRVVLSLLIGEDGRVLEAAIVESGDPALDQRALEAARQFQFEPARRDGVPLRARIQYAYLFEAAAPPPAPPPPAAPTATATTPAEPMPAPAPPAPLPQAELEHFEATARVEAPPREVTKRTIETDVIRRLPGTRGDVLRSIEVMPGVARTSVDSGEPILRGAGFNESQTMLNGTPVPFLYHFGGLTSFLSSKMVSRIDLYPGNFSVRYGRVAGGIVEVGARDPSSDRLRLALDLNLIDSSAFVEAPLGERTGVAAAVRRSNIDFVFENFVPEDAYSVLAAPVYYDYQLFAVHRFSESTRLRVLGYGSRDTIKLLLSDPLDEDPAISGGVEGKLEFHRVGLELESKPNSSLQGSASATFGKFDIVQKIGAFQQVLDAYEVFGRAEMAAELDPALRLVVGGDFAAFLASGAFRGPQPGAFEGDPRDDDPLGSQNVISVVDDGLRTVKPAAYLELGYRPLPNLLLVPGVRADYFSDIQHWSIDPRLAARYEVTPETALKWGVGMFTQSHEIWQALDSVGNPQIEPYRALQTSAGFEQRLGERAKVSFEGFYKRLYDYIVSTPSHEAPHYLNAGSGRVFGGEAAGELRTRGGGLFYFAYTLSRSERRNDPDADYRLFDQDQTHVLSLTGSQDLGKGWEVGARFRYVTGNPTTPVTGSVYDARAGVYIPIYGALNSDRNPAFHQLDLRVEKKWRAGPVDVAAYLDLQNAYNAENQEGFRYSYDYSKREAVSGLPIFPNIGVRGEL